MTHLPPTISTEAVYKTADLFKSDSPQVANLLRRSSYVDNLIDSQPSMTTALRTAHKTERMLAKGGFAVKCWQFSGESSRHTGCELQAKDTAYTHESPRSRWNPEKDTVVFEVTLNFSKKKKGIHTVPSLKKSDLPQALPLVLTRRIVLGQVMTIYDPLGFVYPYTLFGKVYLPETWSRKLDWDDQLPDELHAKWVHFFNTLFQLEQLELHRCLRPPNSVGLPWLIILNDGSNLAFGFAAHIRWQLDSGDYWCRLNHGKVSHCPSEQVIYSPDGVKCCPAVQTREEGY